MAQHDFVINNQGFPAFRSDLNDFLNAVRTSHSGTSTPSGAVAGTIWLDTTSATTPTLKYYDGTDNISLATIDHVANTVNWLDSTVSITGLSTTATGTVLTLTDSANTTTVNLILDNQKEIRFRETTANGTNYVALKAPASVSADLTFTLPATDGTNGQVLTTNGSGVLSFTTPSAGISWQSSVKTSGFTAVAGEGYFCNTTSAGFTVTLPATPTAGQQVAVVDYAGTADTNAIIISPNGNKIEGGTSNLQLTGDREGVNLVYIDSTQGWLASSGIQEGTDALSTIPYTVDFLVIAGGGAGGSSGAVGGGGGAGGYRNSYSTETSGGGGSSEASLSFSGGVVYTITVGAGGSGGQGTGGGANGSNSSISGTGISTITSIGGGGGGAVSTGNGYTGGSGGGSSGDSSVSAGGSGTANQGYNGGFQSGGNGGYGSSGGGGAGAVGGNSSGSGPGNIAGNGGNGLASSITGSSVTRGGGGGGADNTGGDFGTGGTGGGGRGASDYLTDNAVAGTANTGGGGGGGAGAGFTQKSGGSGVVILRMPTASYSGTTTGSPTVTTDGSDTILVYNASGSITG
jgi:hypothetical protein